MSFDIINRWTLAVIYKSDSANNCGEAAREALEIDANLTRADLTDADLTGANLTRADLYGANGILPNNITPLQISGTKHDVIVREPGYVTIGCLHKPLMWWEEHYRATGRTEGYSDKQVDEYGEHIAHCRRWMELYGVAEAETAEKEPEVSTPWISPSEYPGRHHSPSNRASGRNIGNQGHGLS